MLNNFWNIENRFIVTLIYLLVFSVLLSSCQTVITDKVNPVSYSYKDTEIKDASLIVMNDGSYIKLVNQKLFFRIKYNNEENILIIKKVTDDENNDVSVIDSNHIDRLIPVMNVKEIYIQKRETDEVKTVFSVIGIIAGAALALILIVGITFSNHPPRSCPYIYSFDGMNYVLDAEPLGGAVCEGLERTDISHLRNLKSVNGKFDVLVRNVNDEQQRIDELKFINVKHLDSEFVTPDFNHNFYKYKNLIKPQSALNENGKDLRKFFTEKDNVKWQTELPIDTALKSPYPKETITLKFPKPDKAKSAMLLINGGASYFGSNMIKEVLDLKGNKVDEWYKSIYPNSDEQKKLFNVMHRDETYYLDIKINDGGTLRNSGIMRSTGPMVDDDVLYPLDLENINSDFVEIVLTPQRHFWKFDQINIVYDFEKVNPLDIEILKTSYAKDNNGNDIIKKLSAADKDYYRMPNIGDKTNILINAPENFDSKTNDIFVQTTGWYDINLEKNKPPQTELINNIYSRENSLYDYALRLYFDALKNISQTFNSRRQ